MKHWKQITFFTLFSFFGFGQNLTFKIVKDQPDDVANYWINLGLFEAGFATENLGLYGNVSLNSIVHYKNKVGGEFTMRKSYFNLDDIDNTSPGGSFEIGAFYNLFSKTKSKNQKIILSQKKSGNTTTTVSMKIPATKMTSFGVRAGFNTFKNPVLGDTAYHKFDGTVDFRSSGLYAGILITRQLNVKAHTSEYGIKGAGFYKRTYVDVLFNPIRSVETIEGIANSYVDGSTDKPSAIGFRLGLEFLPVEPRKVQGNAIYQKIELGSKPWNGYYFQYTAGINFKRKVKSMSSFKVVREME
jgi:hypothetical protein